MYMLALQKIGPSQERLLEAERNRGGSSKGKKFDQVEFMYD